MMLMGICWISNLKKAVDATHYHLSLNLNINNFTGNAVDFYDAMYQMMIPWKLDVANIICSLVLKNVFNITN